MLEAIRERPDDDAHWLALAESPWDNGRDDEAVVVSVFWPVGRDDIESGAPIEHAL